MPYGSLHNYIEVRRRRAGLSQDELAVLIGVEHRGTVSRYEKGIKLPDLASVLSLELALGVPACQLFGGLAERVREDVIQRAKALLESLDDTPSEDWSIKVDSLSRLARLDELPVIPWEEAQ